jgi:hypothetical protein
MTRVLEILASVCSAAFVLTTIVGIELSTRPANADTFDIDCGVSGDERCWNNTQLCQEDPYNAGLCGQYADIVYPYLLNCLCIADDPGGDPANWSCACLVDQP